MIFLLSYVLLFFTGIISLPLCFLLTPLVSNSWLKPMLFLFHNRADLWHLKAEVLFFSIISAWLCYYLKCDEMRRATVTDEERPAGGFWRWGTPLDARWGLYLSANLAVGSLLTRVKKISGCEDRRPSNRWDHVRHRRKVKWFDQQGTDPVEYNSSKKSTLYEIYNNKSIKQAEELNLSPSYLSGLTTVSSVQERCRVGSKVIRRALAGALVMTLLTALKLTMFHKNN